MSNKIVQGSVKKLVALAHIRNARTDIEDDDQQRAEETIDFDNG